MSSSEGPTFHGGPLPFITISASGECVVEEYAAKILSQIKGKIAVITVAGLYRTGKSYLMNRLIGMQEGFEIGPTVNPCTKGIWIWGQPVQLGEDYYAILIDTEGLGSGNKGSVDLIIFTLSVLLSSFFVYNSMGAISEETLDQLAVVSSAVRMVHGKSSSDASSSDSFSSPPLLWVLRDFNLKLVNEYNQVVSAQDYLETCLKPVSGGGEKNAIRESIKTLFPDRDCLTMARPVESESELRQINKVPFESLRPGFKSQVEKFVEKVYTSIEPKRVGGVVLDGLMFTQLVGQYCAILNASQGGVVEGLNVSAWTNVVQTQLRSSLRDAIGVYRSVLNDDGMKRLPLNDNQLKAVHLKGKGLAKAAFPKALLASLHGGDGGQVPDGGAEMNQSISASDVSSPDMYFREFRVRREQLLEHLRAENARVSSGEIEKIFNELVKQLIDPVVSACSPSLLLETWRTVTAALEQQCVSRYPSAAVNSFMIKNLIPAIISVSAAHIANMGIGGSRRGGSPALEEFSGQERKQWTERVIQLETQLEEGKAAIEEISLRAGREVAAGKEIERSLREAIRQLQEKNSAGDSKTASSAMPEGVMAEIVSIRELLVSSLTRIQSAESDSRSIEVKAENERNMIELERKFNKQLNEARKKNGMMIDDLRTNYEDEIAKLRSQKSELQDLVRELEKHNALKNGEIDKLTLALAADENDRNLKANFANVVNMQSELVLQFLRNGSQLNGGQMRDLEKATAQAGELRPTPRPPLIGNKFSQGA